MTAAVTATVTIAVRFANGEYACDPTTWIRSSYDLNAAHLWLRPIDETDEARAAWLAGVRKQMGYPASGHLSAVRGRP